MHRHSARLMRLAGGALVATAIAPWLGGAVAMAADASTDSDCNTQPSSVPSGYSCLILDEPTGQDSALWGETWYQRDDTNHLNLLIFPVDSLDQGDSIQVCARDTAPYDPVNNGQVDKCAGNSTDRVYVGSDLSLSLDLKNFVDPDSTAYFVVHVNQGGATTTSQGSAEAPPPPEQEEPTGTVTPSCDSATVDVAAGTEDTTFVISQTGKDDVQDAVAAGDSDHVVVPWSGDDTVSVSVLDGEGALDSATRDSESCDVNPPETVTNPNVAFSNSCTGGIAVVLSNMDANAPVTFHVVAGDNGVGTVQDVKVNADEIRRLHFKVAEDTTGTVTVKADGLSKATHSFAKDCTKVLGEKHVRTPQDPQVQGEQQLPFTGLPTGLATALAGLMLAAGGGLMVAGRRRTARHAE